MPGSTQLPRGRSFPPASAAVKAASVPAEADGELPQPSRIEDLRHLPDYDYDGVWMLFDIDESRISSRARRFNATLPENLLAAIDDYVAKHGGSRSGFLADAARAKLKTV